MTQKFLSKDEYPPIKHKMSCKFAVCSPVNFKIHYILLDANVLVCIKY